MFKLNEKVLKQKERKDFGLPEDKAYPMPDAEHVRKAIQLFHNCPKDKKKKLARAIQRKAKKYNIEISKDSEVYKILHEELLKETIVNIVGYKKLEDIISKIKLFLDSTDYKITSYNNFEVGNFQLHNFFKLEFQNKTDEKKLFKLTKDLNLFLQKNLNFSKTAIFFALDEHSIFGGFTFTNLEQREKIYIEINSIFKDKLYNNITDKEFEKKYKKVILKPKDIEALMVIDFRLFLDENKFSSREIAAIIFHELGHHINFGQTILDLYKYTESVFERFKLKYFENNNFLNRIIYNLILFYYERHEDLNYDLGEKHADSYANQVGYGKEIMTAIRKLYSKQQKEVNKLVIFDFMKENINSEIENRKRRRIEETIAAIDEEIKFTKDTEELEYLNRTRKILVGYLKN